MEARRFRVELRCLDELEEEVGQPLPQAGQGGLGSAAIEHIRLPIDEFDNVPRQIAVKLLDRPFDVTSLRKMVSE